MNRIYPLSNKVILITKGNSTFSRRLSLEFAKAGAHIILSCSHFTDNAVISKMEIENENVECHLVAGDIHDHTYCMGLIQMIFQKYGKLDVLVNNNFSPNYPLSILPAHIRKELFSISKMGIFAYQKLTEAAIEIMAPDGNIINNQVMDDTLDINAFDFFDNTSSLRTFTEFYSKRLVRKKIKANAVVYPEKTYSQGGYDKNIQGFIVSNDKLGPTTICPFLYLASNSSQGMTGKLLSTRPIDKDFAVISDN